MTAVADEARVLRIARGFSLPLAVAGETTGILATKGAGKSYLSAAVIEEMFAARVQLVVFDPTGVYWGLRAGADGNPKGGLPIIVLGGPHGDAPLEETAGSLIADLLVDTGQSLVLDLSDFPSKAAQTRFATDLAERLYVRKARSRTLLHVVLDEAEEFIPQYVGKETARMVGAWERIVSLGRSRGLGATLISRRSQAINKRVLDLIETLVIGRMLAPKSIAAVAGWIDAKEEKDAGVLDTLRKLPTGEVWVWTPVRGVLERVKVRRLRTYDSYFTPKAGEVRAEPEALVPIDLAKLGEQIRATAEEAAENDPRNLRVRLAHAEGRIRELEADLNGRAEPERVEVRVEVPVLSDADRAYFEHVRKAIDGLGEQFITVGDAVRERLEALDARVRETEQGRTTPVAAPPVRPSAGSPPHPAPAPSPPRRDPPPAPSGKVDPSQQKVLDALAWYEAVEIPTPTKMQVAFVAGYKVTKNMGGRFGNLLGGLHTAGLIHYPMAGTAALTVEGRALARDPGLPRTSAAVQAAVLDRLPPSEAKLLREILRAHPRSITRVDLAVATGYSPDSVGGGRFANLLGRLRTLGLIEYPRGGEVVALDVLFPLG